MVEGLATFAADLPDDAELLQEKIIDTFVTIHRLLKKINDQIVLNGYLLPPDFTERWGTLWEEMEREYSTLEASDKKEEALLRLNSLTQSMFDHALSEMPDVVDNAGRELQDSCDTGGGRFPNRR